MPLTGSAKKIYMCGYMRRRRLIPEIRLSENLAARLRWQKGGGYKPIVGSCEVCGYSQTVDIHHEGLLRKEHTLCPNCHALITRGLKTLEELPRGSNNGT